MFSNLSRRSRVRIISYLCALAVVFGGFSLRQMQHERALERALSNSYQRAFSQLTASLDQMDAALQKGRYVTTAPMLCSLCGEIYAQSITAQNALGQIPFACDELENTGAFVARVGDYAQSLSRSAARTGKYTEEDNTRWQALSGSVEKLSQQLDTLELALFDGSISLEGVEQAEARLNEKAQPDSTESPLSAMEDDQQEFPSLIYDGPFSQHLTVTDPKLLKGAELVPVSDARSRASRILGRSVGELSRTIEGSCPCYVFPVTVNGETGSIAMTKQGGFLLSYFSPHIPSAARLTPEQGICAAEDFLADLDYPDMAESYYSLQSNHLTVNFCFVQNGVRYYRDLVKVTVSMETGEILGFEGQGYLNNHTRRGESVFAVSREEAQSRISPQLRILDVNQAAIPSPGDEEITCWEFLCQTEDGQHLISYISGTTGDEEQLFLLLEDEHGTLAY